MCKISVIVPVYNVEKYLEKCIISILGQTFKDFELILVNDGSTDSSGEICNKYKKIDERIKVIYQKNSGLSAARNAGLEMAKGDYIGFVDSDDYINNNMYETMFKLAQENNADIVQCKFKKFYNDFLEENEENNTNRIFNISNSEEALYKLLSIGDMNVQCVVAWNKLYKSNLFNDIRFPIAKIHEDEFTTYKLFDKSKKIVFCESEMYYYRQVDGSIMNSKFNKRRLHYLEALEEQLCYFENRNKEIYKEILIKYELNLKIYYFRVKSNIENNKEILKEIRKKYYVVFKKLCENNKFMLKRKLINILFLVSPNLFQKIQKNRHKDLY
ncbi:glycosyltransferase [Clostridium sp. NSJ-145]|uniref:glycosyltransferase family 2 protein n=1 Tax=Clostridium sp. NSJ-145 TaxID=2897777 RepID=UPI001E41F0A3|nr:glycosyltransferase [Clostridium sp. NSJ-145]MCD2502361.1 glycosyltransferase [Clostridium sp. NSJ-145]